MEEEVIVTPEINEEVVVKTPEELAEEVTGTEIEIETSEVSSTEDVTEAE